MDDAEDGAFARIRHRLARKCRAACHGARQTFGGQSFARAKRFGNTLEELRNDRSGIAAGAINGFGRSASQYFPGTRKLWCTHAGKYGRQRERHVCSGVAIGHRKHIDPVDLVATRDHALDAGRQSAPQSVTRESLHADLCSQAALPELIEA